MRPLDPLRRLALHLERLRMPAPMPDEVRLFAEADALLDGGTSPEDARTADGLGRLAERHGTDVATALFYRAQRREHAAFCARVEAPLPASLPRLRGRLVVVPAPQHDALPGFGGDGALVRRVAQAFGLASDVVPLSSYGSLDANAQRIGAKLSAQDGPVWLVSMSKGSADVRALFEARPEAARGLAAWVSVCGLVQGSALDGCMPAWQKRLGAALLGVPVRVLDEISADGRLGAPFAPPAGLRTVSVVGCPLEAHVTTGATRTRYRRLAVRGPNDGAVLLPHAVVPSGAVVPVWGADHYFRVPGAARLLYGLFHALSDAA